MTGCGAASASAHLARGLKLPLFLLAPAFLVAGTCASLADDLAPSAPGPHVIHFTESAPQSGADEVKWRLHAVEDPGPFEIARERFQLLIPKSDRADEPWGLFIWISAGDGKRFGISYLPDDEVLAIAKQKCRFVLVTGAKDFNRVNTRAAEESGFRKEGFASVLYLEVPGLGHAMPDAKWLEQGLGFLDAGEAR